MPTSSCNLVLYVEARLHWDNTDSRLFLSSSYSITRMQNLHIISQKQCKICSSILCFLHRYKYTVNVVYEAEVGAVARRSCEERSNHEEERRSKAITRNEAITRPHRCEKPCLLCSWCSGLSSNIRFETTNSMNQWRMNRGRHKKL
jgi:hypothetical protein